MLPLKLMQRCVLSSSRCPASALFNTPPRWTTLINQNNLKLTSFLCTDVKKSDLSVKSVKGAEILQEALEKRKKKLHQTKLQFQEKKQQFQENIRDKKSKVEEVIIRENILTIPNFLCMSRIAMSPYLGYTIIHADYKIAMGIMLAAAFTDLADGYIARNWEGQKSNFGSFLDPLADKTLVTTLVVTLTYAELMPLWLTSMIVFRDVFLIVAAFVIRYNSLPPEHRTLAKYFDATHATAQLAPTFISKVNTVVQLFTIAVSLGAPIFDYCDHTILHSLWYFTGITTLSAALSYWSERKNTYKYLRKTLEKGKK